MNRTSMNSGHFQMTKYICIWSPPPKQGWVSIGDIIEAIKAKIISNLIKTINPQIHDKSQS